MIVLLFHLHNLEDKQVGGGFFSSNSFSNNFICMKLLLHPLIIQLNEILLNSNNVLLLRVETIHHGVNYISHILCYKIFR